MLKHLANLHKECFPNKPWGEQDFSDLKKSGCEIISSDNGFIVWRVVSDEAEIITIGVSPSARGKGIADALLKLMENDIKTPNTKIFLEVAATNTYAIKLYERNGFEKIGTRRGYYDGVDAILMSKTI